MAYRYDARSGRYRDVRTGRFLSGAVIREAVDNVADLASQRMAELSQRLIDGTLSLASWESSMMAEIKAAHVATGMAAHGGRAMMSPADWGLIGNRIRREYRYLRGFSRSIANGQQPLDGRLIARARQYGQASRPTYENVRLRDDRVRGMTVERNVLSRSEHCGECPKLTAKGWVPIGSLPRIGQRDCRGLDRCRIDRRRVAPQASGVA